MAVDINLPFSQGDALVYNGIPYRLVGPENVAADTTWPALGAPPTHQLYNIKDQTHTTADQNGKKYYSAAEMALAFSPGNHSRSPTTIPGSGDPPGVIYTAPSNGILRIFSTGSAQRLRGYVDDALIFDYDGGFGVGDFPAWNETYNPTTDEGNFQFPNAEYNFDLPFPLRLLSGQAFKAKRTNTTSPGVMYYYFLPDDYTAPP